MSRRGAYVARTRARLRSRMRRAHKGEEAEVMPSSMRQITAVAGAA